MHGRVLKNDVGLKLTKVVVQGVQPPSFGEVVRKRLELADIEQYSDAVVRVMDEQMLEFEKADRLLGIEARGGTSSHLKSKNGNSSGAGAEKAREPGTNGQ